MDFLNYVALLVSASTVILLGTSSLLLVRRRDDERRSRVTVEQIRLRETELKYASAVSAQARHALLDGIWKTIHMLDRIEEDDAVQSSNSLRVSLRDLRSIQHAQLEVLLRSFDDDRGEQDLERLNSLLSERRTELDTLPGIGERGTAS